MEIRTISKYNKIPIKCTKDIEECIKVSSNGVVTMYTYEKINNNGGYYERQKTLCNKDAFVEYLQAIGVAKKYIKQI